MNTWIIILQSVLIYLLINIHITQSGGSKRADDKDNGNQVDVSNGDSNDHDDLTETPTTTTKTTQTHDTVDTHDNTHDDTADSTEWDYDYTSDSNPFYWSQMYATCGGIEQSPINIDSNVHNILNGFEYFGEQLLKHGITQTMNMVADNNHDNAGNNNVIDTTQTPAEQQQQQQDPPCIWDWNNNFVHHFEVTNNGHTIKFIPIDTNGNYLNNNNSGNIAKLTNIFDDSIDFITNKFCLDSIHFHWGEFDNEGSEHLLYGKQFPAEIHFVHYNCDYQSLSDAIQAANEYADEQSDNMNNNSSTNGSTPTHMSQENNKTKNRRPLAVVGMFFEIDDNDSFSEETEVMTKLVNNINLLKKSSSSIRLPNVNLLNNFIPIPFNPKLKYLNKPNNKNSKNQFGSTFWYYKGSLTTPECNEYVHWHLLNSRLKIKKSHLIKLRNIRDLHDKKLTHNWRPVQNNINNIYQFDFHHGDDNSNHTNDHTTSQSPITTSTPTTPTTETTQSPISVEPCSGNGSDNKPSWFAPFWQYFNSMKLTPPAIPPPIPQIPQIPQMNIQPAAPIPQLQYQQQLQLQQQTNYYYWQWWTWCQKWFTQTDYNKKIVGNELSHNSYH